jgi:acyl carrier protein
VGSGIPDTLTEGKESIMTVKEQLKKILIEELNLEDVTPEGIEDDAPLFGEGLGLDSLDAVELVVLLEKHFGVEVINLEEGRLAFQSINTLAAYIEERKAG